MGLNFKKRVRIAKGLHLNFGKKGMSTSIKVGNVTHNSKSGTTVNLGHGFTYKINKNKRGKTTESVKSQFNINDLSDKNKKVYTVLTKITFAICGIMGLLLSVVMPIMIPIAIGCIIFAFKYKLE